MTNLANVMSRIKNAETVGKTEVVLNPISNLIKEVVELMKKNGYIGDYEYIDDNRGGQIKIQLLGKINKCAVITPRFPCKFHEFEKFEKRYLLAKDFGIIILSTPKGVMTHHEAKSKKIGGILLAYVY